MSNWASARAGSRPSTQAYAIPFPPLGERFDRLTEQLHIITGLWTTPVGEKFDYSGHALHRCGIPGAAQTRAVTAPADHHRRRGAKRTPALAAQFAAEFNIPFAPLDMAKTQLRAGRRSAGRGGTVAGLADVFGGVRRVRGRDDAEIARRAAAIGREVDELRSNSPTGGNARRDRGQARPPISRSACSGFTCSFSICPTSTTWSSSPPRSCRNSADPASLPQAAATITGHGRARTPTTHDDEQSPSSAPWYNRTPAVDRGKRGRPRRDRHPHRAP